MQSEVDTMVKATWHDTVLAQSEVFELVEGNVYFPPSSINSEYFRPSSTHTTCGWKGEASYYDIVVGGATNKDAAWYYPQPKSAAANISGYCRVLEGGQGRNLLRVT